MTVSLVIWLILKLCQTGLEFLDAKVGLRSHLSQWLWTKFGKFSKFGKVSKFLENSVHET